MRNWLCPACDAENSSDRVRCKCGHEQGTAVQSPENISSVTIGSDDSVIIKSYHGKQDQAVYLFHADAARMAKQNYYPTSQNWVPGAYGFSDFFWAFVLCFLLVGVLVFIYMLIVKPAGTLSVTYELREDTAPPTDEKTCPRCAEQVKAAAKICRFCGHDFFDEQETE